MNFQPPQRLAQHTDDELTGLLQALSSADGALRVPAESSLRQAEVQPGFAARLARFATASAGEERFPLRQLSFIILKKLLLERWTELSCEDRASASASLMASLAEENKSLRKILHVCVANVLYKQKEWPELHAHLLAGVTHGTPHEALCCVECVKVLLDEGGSQVPASLGPLQQPMLLLATSPDAPPALRRQCVTTTIAGFLQVLAETADVAGDAQRAYQQAVREGFGIRSKAKRGNTAQPSNPVVENLLAALPEWVAVLAALCTGAETWSDRDRVCCAFTAICEATKLCRFPQLEDVLASCLESLLRPACVLVQTLSPAYEASVIHLDDNGASEEEDGVAELVAQLMELLQAMLPRPKIRALLKGHLRNMLSLLMPFLRITAAQERMWRLDPNEFLVLEEDEHANGCLMRRSGEYLLNELLNHTKRETSQAIAGLVADMLERGECKRVAGETAAWKLTEVSLLVFGHVAAEMSTKLLQKGELAPLVPTALGAAARLCTDGSAPEFLRARAFATLWRLRDAVCTLVPKEVPNMLKAAAAGIAPSEHLVVRVCACRTFVRFLTFVEDKRLCEALLLEHGVLASLGSMLREAENQVVETTLESLCIIVKMCPGAMVSVKDDLASLLIEIWNRCKSDPMVHLQVLDLVSCAMGVDEQLRLALEIRLVPPVAQSLAASSMAVAEEPHLVSTAIELYTLLLKKAPTPLSPQLWSCVEPLIASVIRHDESELLQYGCDALCMVLRKSPGQIVEGSLLGPLLQATEHLLGPELSDDGACFVGPFITALLTQLGSQLSADLVSGLLRALVVRLGRATLPYLKQELLVVFGRVLHEDFVGGVAALEALQVQSANGEAMRGLEVLLSIWLEMVDKQEIIARRAANVSVTVFCQLHARCAADANLSALRLRSTTSGQVAGAALPEQLLAAVLSLLEKKNERCRKVKAVAPLDIDDSEDEDGEDDDDGFGEGNKACGRLLSDLLEDDDDDEDDLSNAGLGAEGDSFQELAESDPLYSLDLQKVAATYFASLPQGSLPPQLLGRIVAGVREAQGSPPA